MSVSWKDFKKGHAERKKRMLQQKNAFSGSQQDSYKPPAWKQRMNYFRPDETPTRIRLIPQADGSLWYNYQSRWVSTKAGKRNIYSNSWNGERDVPCVLYYYALEDSNPELLSSPSYALTVLILEEFYKVPKKSKKGNEYFEYVRSKGVDMHGRSLDPPEYKDYEKVFGQKKHWSFWGKTKKRFEEELERVSETCANCGEGVLSVYAYTCPDCGEEIANHKVSPINEDREDILRNSEVDCPSCDAHVRATKNYECVKQEGLGSKARWVKGCHQPIMALPSEMDLIVASEQAGNTSLIKILGCETQDDVDVPNYMTEPFEFNEFFGKMDLDEQARAMGRENPFDRDAQRLVDDFFVAGADEEDDYSSPKFDDEDDYPF